MAPAMAVTTNWPELLIRVLRAACILFECFKKSTLPAYSPIRLGVNTLIVTPANTALKEVNKLMFSILVISIFHLMLSSNQLTGINNIAKNSPFLKFALANKRVRLMLISSQFLLLETLYQIAVNKHRITAILMAYPICLMFFNFLR